VLITSLLKKKNDTKKVSSVLFTSLETSNKNYRKFSTRNGQSFKTCHTQNYWYMIKQRGRERERKKGKEPGEN